MPKKPFAEAKASTIRSKQRQRPNLQGKGWGQSQQQNFGLETNL